MPEDLAMQVPCAQTDPEIFFPVAGDGTRIGQRDRDIAKAICMRCPVRSKCLDWALDSREEYGIWGGMTEEERRAILQKRAKLAEPVAHAIDIRVGNGNGGQFVTTLHTFACKRVQRIADDRKRTVTVGEMSEAWTAAIGGEKGVRFCRACKPWQAVDGLHEGEELYRPTFVTPQVCARCGHHNSDCRRCGEQYGAPMERIQGVPYCHAVGDEPSCFTLQINADMASKAMAS